MPEAVSVVVPTRDRPALLARCLEALAAALGPGDEVVVVDSASTDAGRVRAAAEATGARLVRLDRPGASAARNAGWRAARHALVAFVDDDVLVEDRWAAALATTAAAHPEISFVTGRLTPPPWQAGAERPVAVLDVAEAAVLTRDTPGPLGHGANVAFRRDALEALGGFDERLGPGTLLRAAEDNDLFDRALAAGMLGRYEPAASAWHLQWRDRRMLLGLDWAYGIGGGARLARLRRADPARARRVARGYLWAWGLAPLWRDLRRGYEFGALGTALRLAGTGVGFALCLATRAQASPTAGTPESARSRARAAASGE